MCLEFMPFDSAYHAPVLAAEVVDLLGDRRRVLDCTLGGGGHSLALLERGVGSVTGIDRDAQALAAAGERLGQFAAAGRFSSFQANYSELDAQGDLASQRFDGILLDLGISSHQIDATERGFSFRPGAPLDMRMGDDAPTDALQYARQSPSVGAAPAWTVVTASALTDAPSDGTPYERQDAAWLPLYQFPTLTAWHTDKLDGPVGTFTNSPLGGFQNMYAWSVK